MKTFQNLLASLASTGGNLLILCVFVILSGLAVNKVHYSDQVDTVMIATFSAFSGALLQALTGRALSKVSEEKENESTSSTGK